MVTIKVPFLRRADFLIPIAIATALIISVSVASAVDLERGLVAYYSFDDCSAKDLSGNGNDGIIYGAKCVDGKFGKALRFDGVDDKVNCGNAALLSITDKITLEVWIKTSSWAMKYPTIVSKSRRTTEWDGEYWLAVKASTGQVTFAFAPAGADAIDHWTSTTLSPNTWYHIVATFDDDADQVRIFINGEEDPNSPFTETNTPGATDLDVEIGYGGHTNDYFNGLIDEVRIYNRALSEEEIRALYERGVAPRPKLAIEMDIDTSLKQGEVRKGTIRVENIGN